MTPRVIAIIPARGGSKGLPRKNISDLDGVPLVGWSIAAARASRFNPRVIVSTDCPEIARVSQTLGVEVPFLRPEGISGDSANVEDAISHTLERLREMGETFELLMVLFPTHPFRSPQVLDHLTEMCLGGASQAMTAHRWFWNPNLWFLEKSAELQPVPQDYQGELVHEFNLGNVSWIQFPASLRYKPKDYLLVDDAASLCDIDTEDDLRHARRLVESDSLSWRPGASCSSLPVLSAEIWGQRIKTKVCADGSGAPMEVSFDEVQSPTGMRNYLDSIPKFAGRDVRSEGVAAFNSSQRADCPMLSLSLEHQISSGLRFRVGNGTNWRPFTLEGILHFERTSGWVNAISSERILGRQQFPPVYCWDGAFYLPATLNSDRPWCQFPSSMGMK